MPGITAIIDQPAKSLLACRDIKIEGFEQLRAATPTTKSEIVQIEAGRMQGRLKHATAAGLSLGLGTFSRGLLSRGAYSDDRATIGFLFDQGKRPFHSVGIVTVWSPGAEHEKRYRGGTSFGGISVSVDDMSSFFGAGSRFSDPDALGHGRWFRGNPQTGITAARALRSIMSSFDRRVFEPSQAEAEFWKRAILEAVTWVMLLSEPSQAFVSSPKRLVSRAQDYMDSRGSAPIHISELASVLRVSRRSLHRAFDEVLGISPIRYLRHRRLCEARILLKEGTDANMTVADVAFMHGFSDLGRFASYYHSLFGEYPSDSLKSSHPRLV